MSILDEMTLPSGLMIIPVVKLEPNLRARLDCDDDSAAITRRGARSPSKVVNRDTAALLESFREPKTIVDAVLGYCEEHGLDPEETLKGIHPVLRTLMDAKLLVRVGIAHGWAGMLYAILLWYNAVEEAPPTEMEERLAQLADLGERHGKGRRWPRKLHRKHTGQRLCLARALAHSPAVLILDEPTSHIDALTEARIFDNLAGLDSTRIVIAHRLSTVRRADQIVVLDRGRIVERGAHEDLVTLDGLYHKLVRVQE